MTTQALCNHFRGVKEYHKKGIFEAIKFRAPFWIRFVIFVHFTVRAAKGNNYYVVAIPVSSLQLIFVD